MLFEIYNKNLASFMKQTRSPIPNFDFNCSGFDIGETGITHQWFKSFTIQDRLLFLPEVLLYILEYLHRLPFAVIAITLESGASSGRLLLSEMAKGKPSSIIWAQPFPGFRIR
jgi:hypothetical protein